MHPDLAEYGPMRFHSDPNALYERHLLFDYAIDSDLATPRERYEAVARSLRDVLRAASLWDEPELERRPYEENHSARLVIFSSCIMRGVICTNFTLTPASLNADIFKRISAPNPALSM